MWVVVVFKVDTANKFKNDLSIGVQHVHSSSLIVQYNVQMWISDLLVVRDIVAD